MDTELKAVFDRVVAASINKKNMKILGALNDVKKALNSREYTTTDRSYLKAVLFPEKSKGAKIPSIYPTSTNSFKQSTKFELVVNDNGFFGIAMDVENTSNLVPVFYEFNQGQLEDWGIPRHFRFDGTQTSMRREGVQDETIPRVSDRKDASLVFDTARVVGASLTATIQKKPEDVYGTFEGALDPTARFEAAEYALGTSPEIVSALLLSIYDSLSNIGVLNANGEPGFKVLYRKQDSSLAQGDYISSLFEDAKNSDLMQLGFASISHRSYLAYVFGVEDNYRNSILSGNITMQRALDGLANRTSFLHDVRTSQTPNDPKSLFTMKKTTAQASSSPFVLAVSELKIIDLVETAVALAGTSLPNTQGQYDGDKFLDFCENLLSVSVQGITHRQREFVKQRLSELVNVRTVPMGSEMFNSDRVRGLSFYSEAKASVGLRVLYVPTRANELIPIHEIKTGPRPFLFVFGHSVAPETRIVIESSRVYETQTNMRYRDYIIPTKAVPDPRSLSIINYIHTTAKWILHIPPLLLGGLYDEIKASLGHFDVALASLGGAKTGGAVTIAEIQERIQQTENIEKIE